MNKYINPPPPPPRICTFKYPSLSNIPKLLYTHTYFEWEIRSKRWDIAVQIIMESNPTIHHHFIPKGYLRELRVESERKIQVKGTKQSRLSSEIVEEVLLRQDT
ncbi:uncharacterized protein LOC121778424 [Salvia splendens]|uniref:uncharacterized protein LOC121778424 n=1 Tax=Salvia splendens TaxID=180675 RepID=UPI001C25D979|nr:uncharacterized protein LOC121778424 [Salvia splendens]